MSDYQTIIRLPSGIPGPEGPQGGKGEKGDKGDKGDTGDTGSDGSNGSNGSTGATGSTGPGYKTTSVTFNAIGTGNKSFAVSTGLAYSAGARVRVSKDSTNYMEGTVTSYTGPNLVLNIDKVTGSGTSTTWNINLAGDPGSAITFSSTSNRQSTTPQFVGQLGVQTDKKILFQSISTNPANGWQAIRLVDYIKTTEGIPNAYTAVNDPPKYTYTKGDTYNVFFTDANTTACTINIDSLGVKAIKIGTGALIEGDILADKVYTIVYDETGVFQIVNSERSSFSGTTDYLPIFTSSTTIGDSPVWKDGDDINFGAAKASINTADGSASFIEGGTIITGDPTNSSVNVDGTIGSSILGTGFLTLNGLYATVLLSGDDAQVKLVSDTNNLLTLSGTGTNAIGVGTDTPSTNLHLVKGSSGAIKIVDGTQGDGKVLTSNANGVGTWVKPYKAFLAQFRPPNINAIATNSTVFDAATIPIDTLVYDDFGGEFNITTGMWIVGTTGRYNMSAYAHITNSPGGWGTTGGIEIGICVHNDSQIYCGNQYSLVGNVMHMDVSCQVLGFHLTQGTAIGVRLINTTANNYISTLGDVLRFSVQKV